MDSISPVNAPGSPFHYPGSKKTILTKSIVTSSPIPKAERSYQYQEDYWEINPKTGYTYGASGAYQKPQIGKPCTSPNMSRRRIRLDMHNMSSSSQYTPPPHTYTHVAEEESYVHDQQNNEDYPTVPNQVNAHPDFSDQDFDEPTTRMLGVHGLRMPASETRSGRKYGQKWDPATAELRGRRRSRRGSKLRETDTDTASEYSEISHTKEYMNYKMLEKQSEYSGSDNMMKERELNHLHGLDSSDADASDNEAVILPPPTPAPPIYIEEKTTVVYTILTTITTIMSTIGSKLMIFGRDRSSNRYSTHSRSSYADTESKSMVQKLSSAVIYPFHLMYSLLIAVISYIWRGVVFSGETLKWLVYGAWVGERRGVEESLTADDHSASGVDKYGTTTTTTTTVTTTEYFSDDEEEKGYDAVDVGKRPRLFGRRTKKGKPKGVVEVEENDDSWFYTFIKTVVTTVVTVTSTVLWSPVTATQAIGRGAKNTITWIIPGNSSVEKNTTNTESTETSTLSGESHVRRRSSRLSHRDVYEEDVSLNRRSENAWWLTRWCSLFTSSMRNGLDDLAFGVNAIVLFPVGLCYGLARAVSRAVLWVGGAGYRVWRTVYARRGEADEDADVDTAVASHTRKSTTVTYSRYSHSTMTSSNTVSWYTRVSRSLLAVLLWPWSLCLAVLRWLWWGVCAPFRWVRGASAGSLPSPVLWLLDGCHRKVANSVVKDVWLLSRTSVLYRRYGCCCLIPLLLLLPLLLTGTYYVYDRSMFVFPLAAVNETSTTKTATAAGAIYRDSGAIYTDSDLDARIRIIVAEVLRNQKAAEPLTAPPPIVAAGVGTSSDSKSEAIIVEQYKQEFQTLIANIINEKFSPVELNMKTHGSDVANQMAAVSQQGNELSALQAELLALTAKINELTLQISEASAKMDSQDEEIRKEGAAAKIALEKKLEAFQLALRDCCKTDSALALLIRKGVEDHLALMLRGGDGGIPLGASDEKQSFLTWLQTRFVNREDMDSRLTSLLAKIENDIKTTSNEALDAKTIAEAAAAAAAAKAASDSSTTRRVVVGGAVGGVDEEHVKELIHDALSLYGADKTGKVDYALESAGGSVVNTRCSETYYRRTAQLSLFGVPLWYTSNSARTVIQPDMQPGQCWAFRGSKGFLVIQLASSIYPTSFTLEHIPKALSPSGMIDSAPKDFSVWGLEYDQDREGRLLGNFTYLDNGEPLQTFIPEVLPVKQYHIVELKIHSNHGNKDYTCLYRFRIHGNLHP